MRHTCVHSDKKMSQARPKKAFRSKYPNTPLGERFKKRQKPQKSLVFQGTSMSVEKKNIDTFNGLTTPGGAQWSIPIFINDTSSGTNASGGRIGRKIRMTSIQLRYNFLRSGSNGPSQVRIVVVYDKQPTGALPTALDIFNQDNSCAFLSLTNSGHRFVTLIDELSDTMSSSALNISGYRYRKIGLESHWPQGASSGIAQIKSGAIYLLASNNDSATGAVAMNLDCITRIRYTDV